MKWRFIISWCLVAIMLCSCTANKTTQDGNYSIYTKDGVWYMEFHSDSPGDDQMTPGSDQPQANASMTKEYPQFETISDMQSKIKNGDIPERQLASLQADSTNNVLEICDPDELWDLTMPGDLAYDYIVWHGNTYSFQFIQTDLLGYFECCDEETYHQQFEENYGPFSNENCSVFADKSISDRNAREVMYMTRSAMLKDVLYNFSSAQWNIYVVERYALAYFSNPAAHEEYTSETVPQSIRIFGNDGNRYFYGWMTELVERPTLEWLGAFGLAPIADND